MKQNRYGIWPETEEELIAYLREEENKYHDYDSFIESLANVTVAMFNYFASKYGMTGFQTSIAGLKFLRITRGIEGPFGIVDGTKMLYPQYDILDEVKNWLEEWKPEVGRLAKEKLEKLISENTLVSEAVINRWIELAKYAD